MNEDERRVEKDLAPKLVVPDPFADDEPLACGVENPEACDSCQ